MPHDAPASELPGSTCSQRPPHHSMLLQVAADNAVAVRLYEHSGYTEVKRTGTGACRCMASAVFKWFLGHPGGSSCVWRGWGFRRGG